MYEVIRYIAICIGLVVWLALVAIGVWQTLKKIGR